MMKFVAVLLMLIVAASAVEFDLEVTPEEFPMPEKSGTECKICIEFVQESLQELIEIIANVGLGGGCSLVCSKLPGKLLETVCDLACEILGIEEFAKLVNEVDPDPIYICSKANFCEHSTTAQANITTFSVVPKQGRQGTTFNIELGYHVAATIATGEFAVEVLPPIGMPFGDGEVVIEQAPGNYGARLQFQAQPNEQEPFEPGTYKVAAAVCEGSCGSKHEWSQTLSEAQTTFEISQ